MRINWNNIYRTIYIALNEQQREYLSLQLKLLEEGLAELNKYDELAIVHKFGSPEELEKILVEVQKYQEEYTGD
nr:MAG TPA: hypothetical protein [Caudoviricetes sp.]